MAIFSILLLVAAAVTATPLQKRDTLPNSVIVGIPQAVPNNITGTLYTTYQPFLDVINGCVPSPAVDVNGNTK